MIRARSALWLTRLQADPLRHANQVRQRVGLHLSHYLGAVGLDGFLGHVELVARLLIEHAAHDECHHLPAVSFERVVSEIKARFVTGLTATVEVIHAEAARDRLEVNTLAGTDTVNSGALAAGVIQLLVNGVLVP